MTKEHSETLKFTSFNCNGLAENKKLNIVLKYIKENHKGIFFLQETHSEPCKESKWMESWDGEIFFNHGTTSSCGVAILMPKKMEYQIVDSYSCKDGRFLMLNVKIENINHILVNIYMPTKDKG